MKTTMIFSLILSIFLTVAISTASATDVGTNEKTSSPGNARYEIIQSNITMRDTYRLDRYTGRVHRLVNSSEDGLVWEEMTVKDRPSITKPSSARFQMFLSGIAAKGTYMIDINSGKTWQLQVIELPSAVDGSVNTLASWIPLKEFHLK